MGLFAGGLFGAFNIENLKQVKRYTTSNTISYFFMDCLMKLLFRSTLQGTLPSASDDGRNMSGGHMRGK